MSELDMTELSGKVAVVTGGSRGIGKAVAAALHAEGASVVVTSRTAESAEESAAEIGERAVGIGAHAADEGAATAAVDAVIERFGRVDVLVNNAGTNPAYGPLIRQDLGRLRKTFDVNLFAPVLWTRLVYDAWMAENGGSVINIASVGGLVIERNIGAYNASKAALIHATKQLAVELAPVRVNAIAPGVVRTRLAEALWREHEPFLSATTPLGRIGEPDDVASAAVFYASDRSAWSTGGVTVLDGGRHLLGPDDGAAAW